jgi:hypothetical protein
MKNILLFLSAFLIFNQITKAQYVNIKITNLVVEIAKKDSLKGDDNHVVLQNNSSKEETVLINTNNLVVKASYKVSTNKSVRRSNLKKSAVNVEVNYVFIYNGNKQKVKTQRIFYLDDERTFEEAQMASFMNGINNTVIRINYKCMLN